MEDQDALPADVSKLTIGDPVGWGQWRNSGGVEPVGPGAPGVSKDYHNQLPVGNDQNRVCGAESTAPRAPGSPEPADQPTPLIPDQPEATGSPFATVPPVVDHAPPQTPAAGVSGERAKKIIDKKGIHTEYHPDTPEKIAAFIRLWHDPEYTVLALSKRYRVTVSTVAHWRKRFGLQAKSKAEALGDSVVNSLVETARASKVMAEVAVSSAARTVEAQVLAGTASGARDLYNPMTDPEIAQIIAEMGRMSREVTPHSDLAAMCRLNLKLLTLATTKLPHNSWSTMILHFEAQLNMMLRVRKIEAELPEGAGDPGALRREAANEMIAEIKSVLSEDEQKTMAGLIAEAATRLRAKAAQVKAQVQDGQG